MKEKTKEKKPARKKWILLLAAFLFFVCNSSVMWAKVQERFFENSINDTLSATVMSGQVVITDTVTAETDEKTDEKTDEEADALDDDASDEKAFRSDDWRLVLVNKQHPIPDDYELKLGTIKTSRGSMKCDKRIIADLEKMIEDAKADGINLVICSPYRPSTRQKYLFNKKVKAYVKSGNSYMDSYYLSAQAVNIPGSSEHEIGLALDIISDRYSGLNEGFADTDAGRWLAKHCMEYGFVLRYPKGKESITGIEYEPWHFRYVGKEAAKYMSRENLCLEEFKEQIRE